MSHSYCQEFFALLGYDLKHDRCRCLVGSEMTGSQTLRRKKPHIDCDGRTRQIQYHQE